MAQRIYLGLGSNLGNRLQNLKDAQNGLAAVCQVKRASAVYETAPWGFNDQPAFLNQVLEISSQLPPQDLLKVIKGLEANLGRTPTFRYGPRLIDIDILIYADLVLHAENLTIPHAMINQRAFVLVPLAELAGDMTLPGTTKTIAELMAAVDCSGVTRFEPQQELNQ
ncbi:MAG: 2-amino-4-hydroxy-6-hydroxymethyldihydropteridine diphosphokinase [Anaerolineae bacterium]|nr:2-amino-4-hydroxy-6-hydroxymethyldihydropteridine diphosphokinase [Anaerolineae bacterium]